ncbi:MAG TPA: hypothetical protein VJG32_02975 [Anaerolineae bacterium]|nr:hypothetical protein [Anaerolineae bacterium]
MRRRLVEAGRHFQPEWHGVAALDGIDIELLQRGQTLVLALHGASIAGDDCGDGGRDVIPHDLIQVDPALWSGSRVHRLSPRAPYAVMRTARMNPFVHHTMPISTAAPTSKPMISMTAFSFLRVSFVGQAHTSRDEGGRRRDE